MNKFSYSCTTLASATQEDLEDTWFTFAVNPALLIAGTNTLAVEVHQAAVNSPDLSFDAQLIVLAGAAVQTGTTGDRSFSASPILSLAGNLGFGTAYSLDGTTHKDLSNGQSLPLAFPEALQEFRVETSGSSAKDGEAASVDTVTKSGANLFHGSLFENNQTQHGSARNQFLAIKPPLTFNQFGGSVGGPIVRNKLFFFGVYEGYRLRSFQSVNGNVPTAEFRSQAIAAVPAYKTFLDIIPLPIAQFDSSQG